MADNAKARKYLIKLLDNDKRFRWKEVGKNKIPTGRKVSVGYWSGDYFNQNVIEKYLSPSGHYHVLNSEDDLTKYNLEEFTHWKELDTPSQP